VRRYMPLTFGTMVVASLALVGFPLTSGYLSKDALLIHAFEWAAWHRGATHLIPYVLAIVSVLTSFYIFRLLANVFFGKPTLPALANGQAKLHESPAWMTVPMVLLAACSLFPLFSLSPLNGDHAWLLQEIIARNPWPSLPILHTAVPVATALATLLMALWVWRWYVQGTHTPKTGNLLYRLSLNQ